MLIFHCPFLLQCQVVRVYLLCVAQLFQVFQVFVHRGLFSYVSAVVSEFCAVASFYFSIRLTHRVSPSYRGCSLFEKCNRRLSSYTYHFTFYIIIDSKINCVFMPQFH